MATLTATIKYVTNIAEQVDALRKFDDQIVATTAGANKLANSLGGDKILAAANNLVAAVARLGGAADGLASSEQILAGVTKLTTTEKEKLNTQLTSAISKYQILGQQAPTAMVALRDATAAVNPPTQSLVDQIKGAVPSVGSLTAEVGKLAVGYVAGMASIEAFRRAGEAAIGFLVTSVEAAGTADAAQRKLTTALLDQGQASGTVIGQYRALSLQYEDTTVFSRVLLTETEALLVQVGGVMPAQMNLALRATTDLASGLGIDLKQAAMLVAKSFEDNFTALKKAGVQIDTTRASAEGMTYVLGEIERRFGGQARAELDSYGGRLQQLQNFYDGLKESVGRAALGTGLLQVALALVGGEILKSTAELNAIIVTMKALAAIPGPMGEPFRLLFGQIQEGSKHAANFGKDVNLASESTRSFAQQLTDARAHLAALTPEQIANLNAALKLGAATGDLQKQFHLTAGEIDLYKQQLADAKTNNDKAAAAAKAHADEVDKFANILNKSTLVSLSSYLSKLGETATLWIPAAIVATQALAESHRNLAPDVTAAAMAMAQSGLSADEIATKLKKAKDITDDDVPALKSLVSTTQEWDKVMQSANLPLAAILKNLPQATLSSNAWTLSVQAVANAHRTLNPELLQAVKNYESTGLSVDQAIEELKKHRAITDEDAAAIKAQAKQVDELGPLFDGLSQAFARLSQISGKSFGGVAKDIGITVGAMSAGYKSGTDLKLAFQDLQKPTANVGADVGKMATALVGAVGALDAATQGTHALTNAMSGAATGAAIGTSIMPGWGTAIGAVVGAIWGAVSAHGHLIEQNQALLTKFQQSQGGIEQWATSMKLAGFSIQGVLNQIGSEDFPQLLEGIQKQMAKITKIMADGFADTEDLASVAFSLFLKQAEDLGTNTVEIGKYMKTELGNAAAGLNAIFTGLQASATASAQAAARATGTMTDDEIAKIVGNVSLTKDELKGLGASVIGTFADMMARGSSFKDAIAAIQPAFDALRTAMKNAGVEGDAAFKTLEAMSDIAKDAVAGPLVDAITGANTALKSLQNAGILNQAEFGALADTAVDAYDKIIAQGKDGDAALLLMKPTLQTIWDLQQNYGYQVDDSTQKLLDQAVKAGIVGATQEDAMTQVVKAMGKVVSSLEEIAKKLGVLPGAAIDAVGGINKAVKDVPTDITINFNGKYNPPADPLPNGGPTYTPDYGNSPDQAHAGALVTANGVRRFHGGTARVLPFPGRLGSGEVPAILQEGEAVLRRQAVDALGTDAVRALNAMGGGSGGGAGSASGGSLVDFTAMRDELRMLRADQARRDTQFPHTLARAVRDELQKVVNR